MSDSSNSSEQQQDVLNLTQLAASVRAIVDISDRRYHLRTYPNCFVGSEAVDAMISHGIASCTQDAVGIGQVLLQNDLLRHVTRDHDFKDESLFYRFVEDEESHGERSVIKKKSKEDVEGMIKKISWGDFLTKSSNEGDFQAAIPLYQKDQNDNLFESTISDNGLEMIYETAPLDEHNITLLDNVHPPRWIDPTAPAQGKRYNLVVIGAGSGGLVSAAGASGVGAKVALIEMNLLGGDCLNVGCVPSKALLRSARAIHHVRTAGRFGCDIKDPEINIKVDFPKIMERMRRLRAGISPHDSAERFSKELGVDVFFGRGCFTGKNEITVTHDAASAKKASEGDVDSTKTVLRFAKCVIAVGASARIPVKLPGLLSAPFYTNASLFNMTNLPHTFCVMGAGPIGLEMAQAFARFGSAVHVFARSSRIMEKEDPEAAEVVRASLERDGVTFHLNTEYHEIKINTGHPSSCQDGRDQVIICFSDLSKDNSGNSNPSSSPVRQELIADALLVATGRKPNTQGLGLDVAGVEVETKETGRIGLIKINDNLQSPTNKNVFAVGDCAHPYQFTHMADFMARLVIRNALFPLGNAKVSSLLVPWATFTDPEVAHVGLYERDLISRGRKYRTFTRYLKDVDRTILEEETDGFVKIHIDAKTDQILGATIVGQHAGDLISEITVAMQTKTGLETIASVIHPYPTQAEAIRQCGDLYRKTKLTPVVKGLFRNLMAWQR
eukprot:Nk52_evm3s738 gene=Nk52_evmTU3s738